MLKHKVVQPTQQVMDLSRAEMCMSTRTDVDSSLLHRWRVGRVAGSLASAPLSKCGCGGPSCHLNLPIVEEGHRDYNPSTSYIRSGSIIHREASTASAGPFLEKNGPRLRDRARGGHARGTRSDTRTRGHAVKTGTAHRRDAGHCAVRASVRGSHGGAATAPISERDAAEFLISISMAAAHWQVAALAAEPAAVARTARGGGTREGCSQKKGGRYEMAGGHTCRRRRSSQMNGIVVIASALIFTDEPYQSLTTRWQRPLDGGWTPAAHLMCTWSLIVALHLIFLGRAQRGGSRSRCSSASRS